MGLQEEWVRLLEGVIQLKILQLMHNSVLKWSKNSKASHEILQISIGMLPHRKQFLMWLIIVLIRVKAILQKARVVYISGTRLLSRPRDLLLRVPQFLTNGLSRYLLIARWVFRSHRIIIKMPMMLSLKTSRVLQSSTTCLLISSNCLALVQFR